jgi:hypothetical protein
MRGKRNRLSLSLTSNVNGKPDVPPSLPPPVAEDTDAISPMNLPDSGMAQITVEYVSPRE